MRLLVTGGTGVLGRATIPLLAARGDEAVTPTRTELDLFDAAAVGRALAGVDAVLHLATRIPSTEGPDAWHENDRLRAKGSAVLVDAALRERVASYVQPTVAFVYPRKGAVDEETPVGVVHPSLRSALVAEAQAKRFAAAGRRGVVLRLGLLDGPGTDNDRPNGRYGATLHVDDAGRALVAALELPSGVYNVCRDDERVSNRRFREATGWAPRR